MTPASTESSGLVPHMVVGEDKPRGVAAEAETAAYLCTVGAETHWEVGSCHCRTYSDTAGSFDDYP